MSSCINSICNNKSYNSITTSEHQNKEKDTQELKKKKQIISEKQGKYYYTYIVDEKGQKVLLNKIPVDQADEQKNSRKSMESDKTKFCIYNVTKDAGTTSEVKQQMNMEAVHRGNLRETMDILKESVGIPSKSNKYYGY